MRTQVRRTILVACALASTALVSLPATALSLGGGGHAGAGLDGGGIGVGGNSNIGVNAPGIRAGENTNTAVDTSIPETRTNVGVSSSGNTIVRGNSQSTLGDMSGNTSTSVDTQTDVRGHRRVRQHPYPESSGDVSTRSRLNTTDSVGHTGASATGSANITATNPGGSPSLNTDTSTKTVIGR